MAWKAEDFLVDGMFSFLLEIVKKIFFFPESVDFVNCTFWGEFYGVGGMLHAFRNIVLFNPCNTLYME